MLPPHRDWEIAASLEYILQTSEYVHIYKHTASCMVTYSCHSDRLYSVLRPRTGCTRVIYFSITSSVRNVS